MLYFIMMKQSNNDDDLDSHIVTFFSNDIYLNIDVNNKNLNNVNLVDNNFDDCHPKSINLVRFMAWYHRFTQYEAYKKEISKELMPVAWHPTRCQDWCILEDGRKKMEPFLIDEKWHIVNKLLKVSRSW